MYKKKWQNLRKVDDIFELEPEIIQKTQCSSRVNFTHVAFDCYEEHLVATDSAGYLYYVDLSNNSACYQKLGNVGQPTFIIFNPINKFEILMGLTTGDIKILKVDVNITQFCLLIAHKLPPVHVSFYKKYCLTSSHKEVIIWCLRSCSKAQQLRVNTKNIVVKKASFSNLGHIVVLYYNDTLQAWKFDRLEDDVKIDTKRFDIRNTKDFVFTHNGRAMILSSAQNKIIILNTCDWNLLKILSLPDNFIGLKQLLLVPSPLDGGANNVLACISSNGTLYFFDLNLSCIIHTLQVIKPLRKILVSSTGRYIAYIEQEGHLKLIITEKLFSQKCKSLQKLKDPCRPQAHRKCDHLQCVRQLMEQELHIERLIPILKEFGEYPEAYRVLIWSTILRLPGNRNAYSALANKAANASFTSELLKDYPLANRSKKTLLSTIINCLIQWCPLLTQCSLLPNLVFPFLMVFQKDPLLGFELILSILLNYCQKWFEYHPLPPLNVLGIIENILLHADPSLLNIFCERGITSSEYAWPLLKTAMSEILSDTEWLILWDYLISFQRPSLLLMSVIAYSICSRKIIISSLHSPENFKRYFTSQGNITAKELFKVAQQLDDNIPLRIHPSRYLRNELITLPSKGPYPPFMIHDFPKFLTDDISLLEFEKLKEKERVTREQNRTAIETAETKRLKHEAKSFMNQIHETRLNEVQKCIKQQLCDMDWRFITTPNKPKTQKTCEHIDVSSEEDNVDYITVKSKNYEQMQRDVDKLEYEVQSLLNSLRSQKSRAENT
ncbi:TBC1 domain family member 31 [Hylaeus anthracinus]|uniref:TBC1 domain family member 31 n=1 Tax=Hylaeus anthracinus TaxID=313031 RepID=UPI0023B97109|nr:TBC1 domain family member 31 [Hylaeus anthracinus]